MEHICHRYIKQCVHFCWVNDDWFIPECPQFLR